MSITHESIHGFNLVGKPTRTDGAGWERIDVYAGKRDGEKARERRFAAGADDISPQVSTYGPGANRQYHGNCNCCWFGFSHTTALHDREAVGAW